MQTKKPALTCGNLVSAGNSAIRMLRVEFKRNKLCSEGKAM